MEITLLLGGFDWLGGRLSVWPLLAGALGGHVGDHAPRGWFSLAVSNCAVEGLSARLLLARELWGDVVEHAPPRRL